MKTGMDLEYIHDRIFNQYGENRLRFMGNAFLNKMQINPLLRTAVIPISEEEMLQYEIKSGDTEGIVNMPLTIENIVFSAIITETQHIVKMSFRSKGDFDVDVFARENFDGGGHKNAAGGRSTMSLEETVAKFHKVLPKYKDSLLIKLSS